MDAGEKRLREICKVLRSVPLDRWMIPPARKYGTVGHSYLTTTIDSLQFEMALRSDRHTGTPSHSDDYDAWIAVIDPATGKNIEVYLERQGKPLGQRIYSYHLTQGSTDDGRQRHDIVQRDKRSPTPGLIYALYRKMHDQINDAQRASERTAAARTIALGRSELEKILRRA